MQPTHLLQPIHYHAAYPPATAPSTTMHYQQPTHLLQPIHYRAAYPPTVLVNGGQRWLAARRPPPILHRGTAPLDSRVQLTPNHPSEPGTSPGPRCSLGATGPGQNPGRVSPRGRGFGEQGAGWEHATAAAAACCAAGVGDWAG